MISHSTSCVRLLLCVLFGSFMLASAGCATTGPFKEFAEDVRQLHVGMTPEEVTVALGPRDSWGYEEQHCGPKCIGWIYRRRGTLQHVFLTIYFKDGRVVDWEEWAPALNL